MHQTIGLWNIVFINITAMFNMRWLPLAAVYGASAISLWLIAMLLFFIPLGLVATELATTWPQQGGAYVWVREAFGVRAGFLTSWLYWTSNFFYYPVVLTFIAVTIAFTINSELIQNKFFIYSIVLGLLWLITLINMHSMQAFKKLANLAGIVGTLLPFAIFIGLVGRYIVAAPHSIATIYSFQNWLPNIYTKTNLALLATLMFSMSGNEITPTMAGEVRNPHRTFPRAMLISAFLIGSFYIIGTIALTCILPPEKINIINGINSAIATVTTQLGVPQLTLVLAWLLILGNLGNLAIWIIAPTKMFLTSCHDIALPRWLMQLNKNGMPSRVLACQALLVTMIIIGTSLLPSLSDFYATLALSATIICFLPYLAMFLAFIKLRSQYPQKLRPYRIPGKNWVGFLIAIIGIGGVTLAILLPFIEPFQKLTTAQEVLFYRLELAMGPLLFVTGGYLIYMRLSQRANSKTNPIKKENPS